MLNSLLSEAQLSPFILSAITLIISILFFYSNKIKAALFFLFISSLGIGLSVANLDPFLHLWDEQYHALVAKNMLNNPLKPMLYSNPILEYHKLNWVSNTIWLHKQPLFLWQIALSIKFFGANALAVRIPSILMHAIISIFIYRIGKISYNSNIGYYGALFFAIAYFPLELLVGKYSTDHNDVAFLFYITASFWAWFEYQKSKNKYWLILIGLFSGCAVLVKWLVGLIIFPIWGGANIFIHKKEFLQRNNIIPIIISLSISFLVFIPWQIFILLKYPLEARHEYSLNSRHFFEVIENHGGDFSFHFIAFREIYGGYVLCILILMGSFLLVKNIFDKTYKISIVLAILIVYGFYSMAATKMISFCIIVSPLFYLGLGAFFDTCITFLKSKVKLMKFEVLVNSLFLFIICLSLIKFNKIQTFHSDKSSYKDNNNRIVEINQMKEIEKVSSLLGNGKYVIFNIGKRVNGEISLMFYTNYTAYGQIPLKEEIDEIIKTKKGWKIAIIDNGKLPKYIIDEKKVMKIPM